MLQAVSVEHIEISPLVLIYEVLAPEDMMGKVEFL
jgi:hypothetical protein